MCKTTIIERKSEVSGRTFFTAKSCFHASCKSTWLVVVHCGGTPTCEYTNRRKSSKSRKRRGGATNSIHPCETVDFRRKKGSSPAPSGGIIGSSYQGRASSTNKFLRGAAQNGATPLSSFLWKSWLDEHEHMRWNSGGSDVSYEKLCNPWDGVGANTVIGPVSVAARPAIYPCHTFLLCT